MADANDRGDQCIYLLSYLKTSICDCLKNVEGLNHGRIGLCDLKFNKKLSSGDLIIPAFVRTCFRDHLNGEDNVSVPVKGEKRNYKVVAMEEFQTSYNGFLNFLAYDFWSRSFY